MSQSVPLQRIEVDLPHSLTTKTTRGTVQNITTTTTVCVTNPIVRLRLLLTTKKPTAKPKSRSLEGVSLSLAFHLY
jgi:hypothetical protein